MNGTGQVLFDITWVIPLLITIIIGLLAAILSYLVLKTNNLDKQLQLAKNELYAHIENVQLRLRKEAADAGKAYFDLLERDRDLFRIELEKSTDKLEKSTDKLWTALEKKAEKDETARQQLIDEIRGKPGTDDVAAIMRGVLRELQDGLEHKQSTTLPISAPAQTPKRG